MMSQTAYHLGGFDPSAPNGNKAEESDLDASTFTSWDTAGNVIESRPLTADEIAALTPPTPPPNPTADAYDALAEQLEASDLASERSQAPVYRALAGFERGL